MIFRLSFLKTLMLAGMVLALSACSAADEDGTANNNPPVVLAAASLQEAMEDVAAAWAAHGHPRPALSFAGTPTLARQVESGAPADIIMLADEEWMNRLEANGFLKSGTLHTIVGNRLVVIAPVGTGRSGEMATLTDIPDLLGTGRLAIGDPDSVPAGRYARAALQAAGLWDRLKARTAPAESVRAAMALVERGEAPLGIVYQSDLAASSKVRQVATIGDAFQPEIRYPAAMLATARHPDAISFLTFLQSSEAADIFTRHHFAQIAQP